jgi:hypothetical protein
MWGSFVLYHHMCVLVPSATVEHHCGLTWHQQRSWCISLHESQVFVYFLQPTFDCWLFDCWLFGRLLAVIVCTSGVLARCAGMCAVCGDVRAMTCLIEVPEGGKQVLVLGEVGVAGIPRRISR